MLEYYLSTLFPVNFTEFLAAVAGTYYLRKNPGPEKAVRIFVYFLWITLFVEILGLYTAYTYFTNYKGVEFLKGSLFESNHWLFNIYNIFSYFIYFSFFILHLKIKKNRKILTFLSGFFVFTAILNLIFSGVFFTAFSAYTHIIGTILLILCISAYYYELLTSDRILNFYKNVEFYISIGALVFHVVTTPLFIYSNYFKLQNPDFLSVYFVIMQSVNFFLYGIIILGFLVCTFRRKKVVIT